MDFGSEQRLCDQSHVDLRAIVTILCYDIIMKTLFKILSKVFLEFLETQCKSKKVNTLKRTSWIVSAQILFLGCIHIEILDAVDLIEKYYSIPKVFYNEKWRDFGDPFNTLM